MMALWLLLVASPSLEAYLPSDPLDQESDFAFYWGDFLFNAYPDYPTNNPDYPTNKPNFPTKKNAPLDQTNSVNVEPRALYPMKSLIIQELAASVLDATSRHQLQSRLRLIHKAHEDSVRNGAPEISKDVWLALDGELNLQWSAILAPPPADSKGATRGNSESTREKSWLGAGLVYLSGLSPMVPLARGLLSLKYSRDKSKVALPRDDKDLSRSYSAKSDYFGFLLSDLRLGEDLAHDE